METSPPRANAGCRISDSQSKYLCTHFDPHRRNTPAFVSQSGLSVQETASLLEFIPHTKWEPTTSHHDRLVLCSRAWSGYRLAVFWQPTASIQVLRGLQSSQATSDQCFLHQQKISHIVRNSLPSMRQMIAVIDSPHDSCQRRLKRGSGGAAPAPPHETTRRLPAALLPGATD
ncbi:hypothetical protein HPB50_011247 [Hyalomma asiaticum]|uniref:Uncharacterized protein n=1 Tax=Hyalomma asiaticum TaxID=266040 RepID=A0ACB7SGB5_HYAAI|nr:hypothetical protein HPB50_011247 [Hyalomma asiaticum]